MEKDKQSLNETSGASYINNNSDHLRKSIPKSQGPVDNKKLIRVQFEKYCNESTIHGLNEIVTPKSNYQRFFCAVMFLCAFCAAWYGVWQIIHQFRTTPVSTSYFIEGADSLKLPDVTICPFSRFNKFILDQHNVTNELIAYMEHAFFVSGRKYDFNKRTAIKMILTNKTVLHQMEEQLRMFKSSLNVSTFEELVDKISFRCEDFIAFCMRQYRHINCCDNATPLLTGLGKCYKLHGVVQTGSGFGMGHTIIIRLPLQNFSSGENLLMNDGVLVKLTEPNKGYEFDASFVPTGVHALFQLRSTKMEFLHNPPHFLCHKTPTEEDTYAPLICYQNCLLKPIEDSCKCRYIGLPDHEGNAHLSACNTSHLFNCAYTVLGNKVFSNGSTYARDCRSMCPQRCNYWQYDTTMSYSHYPAYISHHYMNHSEFLRVRNSELILEYFYEKMEYTKIKHFPSMSPETFVANIGGQMSLWIGMSLHGFIHFCVFFAVSVFTFLSPATRKKQREKLRNGNHTPYRFDISADDDDDDADDDFAVCSAELQKLNKPSPPSIKRARRKKKSEKLPNNNNNDKIKMQHNKSICATPPVASSNTSKHRASINRSPYSAQQGAHDERYDSGCDNPPLPDYFQSLYHPNRNPNDATTPSCSSIGSPSMSHHSASSKHKSSSQDFPTFVASKSPCNSVRFNFKISEPKLPSVNDDDCIPYCGFPADGGRRSPPISHAHTEMPPAPAYDHLLNSDLSFTMNQKPSPDLGKFNKRIHEDWDETVVRGPGRPGAGASVNPGSSSVKRRNNQSIITEL